LVSVTKLINYDGKRWFSLQNAWGKLGNEKGSSGGAYLIFLFPQNPLSLQKNQPPRP
jgi:hypothetical protein